MKIGIIVYSYTGNTLSVAGKILESLLNENLDVKIEQVTVENDKETRLNKIVLTNNPDIKEYDMLIFGAPVQAFSLATTYKTYLNQLISLKGKKIICYVTEFFPYKWLGGSKAIKLMTNLCNYKEGEVIDTEVINWSKHNREKQITNLTTKITNKIKSI